FCTLLPTLLSFGFLCCELFGLDHVFFEHQNGFCHFADFVLVILPRNQDRFITISQCPHRRGNRNNRTRNTATDQPCRNRSKKDNNNHKHFSYQSTILDLGRGSWTELILLCLD